jgi:hypothetical protein
MVSYSHLGMRLARSNTVAYWVKKVRDDGWLTRDAAVGREDQKGRAGTRSGLRLLEWLREREDERE